MNGLHDIVASLIFSTTLKNVDSRYRLSQSTRSLTSSSFHPKAAKSRLVVFCMERKLFKYVIFSPRTKGNVLSKELIPEIFYDLFQGSMFVQHSFQKAQ